MRFKHKHFILPQGHIIDAVVEFYWPDVIVIKEILTLEIPGKGSPHPKKRERLISRLIGVQYQIETKFMIDGKIKIIRYMPIGDEEGVL